MKTGRFLLLILVAEIIFSSSCGKKDTRVTLTCHITHPKEGDSFPIGNQVLIAADANQSGGRIDEVRFYIDDIGISSTSSFPYNTTWNTSGYSPGDYVIRVVAFDVARKSVEDLVTITLVDPEAVLPSVTTGQVTVITDSSASIEGNVEGDGGSAVTERGICVSLTGSPDILTGITFPTGTGTGIFSAKLTGLMQDTIYHARAYAVNQNGTNYGELVSFHTLRLTVTDFDGNVYGVVKIGHRLWMMQNLKVIHFRNGDPIPFVSDNDLWGNETPAYCYYDNNVDYASVYGLLYNHFAVSDLRNICPEGWRIPNDLDLADLTAALGGENLAGNRMKEAGNHHWSTENLDATNESRFTAIPGGMRYIDGNYVLIGQSAIWWSSIDDPNTPENAKVFDVSYNSPDLATSSFPRICGFSVRCVKDR